MTVRIYNRVSQEDELDILENQRRETRAEAARIGVSDPVVYEEIESGGNDGRSEFNRLMKEMRAGDLVIFTRPSRMTRGGIGPAFDILRRLEAAGVGWHFTEYSALNFDANTPKLVRDVVLAVMAAVDEDYRHQIKRATRAAYARKKASAEASGVRVRWGRPKGSKSRPCAQCGRSGSAKIHREGFHRFTGPGSCSECGRSQGASVHVPYWHPFAREMATPAPNREKEPEEKAAISRSTV